MLTPESSGQCTSACGRSSQLNLTELIKEGTFIKKRWKCKHLLYSEIGWSCGRKVILFWAGRYNFSFIRQQVIRQFCKTQILLEFYSSILYQDRGLVAPKSRGQETGYRDTSVEKTTQSELRQGKQKERQRTQPRLTHDFLLMRPWTAKPVLGQ